MNMLVFSFAGYVVIVPVFVPSVPVKDFMVESVKSTDDNTRILSLMKTKSLASIFPVNVSAVIVFCSASLIRVLSVPAVLTFIF
jgi:hypothetical protein